MKKNYKAVLGYALVMTFFVLVIVLISLASENKLSKYQKEYAEGSLASQRQIELLEEKINMLSKENEALEAMLHQNQTLGSDLVTTQQAMSDMKDIFLLYKEGKVKEAKTQFERINTMGFDDNLVSYYELLSFLLK